MHSGLLFLRNQASWSQIKRFFYRESLRSRFLSGPSTLTASGACVRPLRDIVPSANWRDVERLAELLRLAVTAIAAGVMRFINWLDVLRQVRLQLT